VGAAIWIAIGYFANYEVGWIAWGIGFLVGLGVRTAADDDEGFSPGMAAAAVAVATILIAKYAVVSLLVTDMAGEFVNEDQIEADTMIASEADSIEEEWKQAGRTVEQPLKAFDDDAPPPGTVRPSSLGRGREAMVGPVG
jgi:hypothetical protein